MAFRSERPSVFAFCGNVGVVVVVVVVLSAKTMAKTVAYLHAKLTV